jgi:hypothetical protein
MTILYVSGDPFLTRAPLLAFGWNALGRAETDSLAAALQTRYPTAFAAFGKQARQDRIQIGTLWTWRDTRPALGFMVVRESPYGTTRVRHVEAIAMMLARDHQREQITSMALVLPGMAYDAPTMCAALERWIAKIALPIVVYTDYAPNVRADESILPL